MIECSVCKGAFDGIAEFEKHLTAEHKLTISSTQIVHYLAYLEQRHQFHRHQFPPVTALVLLEAVLLSGGFVTVKLLCSPFIISSNQIKKNHLSHFK